MHRVIKGAFISLISLMLIGCGATSKEIRVKAQTERTDVFTEIKNAADLPRGFAVLTIKATIKTHLAGYYVLESKESPHGKPNYPFLVNIDGQAETWEGDGQKESLPLYDKDGKTSHDPEAGEGIKYVLEKKIRLRAGTHKVFVVLPAEGYFKEVEMTLREGDAARIEFKPMYKYKTRPTRIPAFRRGMKDMRVYLNGAHI